MQFEYHIKYSCAPHFHLVTFKISDPLLRKIFLKFFSFRIIIEIKYYPVHTCFMRNEIVFVVVHSPHFTVIFFHWRDGWMSVICVEINWAKRKNLQSEHRKQCKASTQNLIVENQNLSGIRSVSDCVCERERIANANLMNERALHKMICEDGCRQLFCGLILSWMASKSLFCCLKKYSNAHRKRDRDEFPGK